MKVFLTASLALLLAQGVYAKSLGTIGQTFPVLEKSLLTLIHERLSAFAQDGTLKNLENAWVRRVEGRATRPTPLPLSRIQKSRTHYYTPVATLHRDVRDAEGRIILNNGMSVNALSQMPLYQPVWVFLNFDDVAERRFADRIKHRYQGIKWILTGGNVREAEEYLNQAVYFDQAGRITQKLGIEHVPALVRRDRESLKIMELAIGEDGHAL